MKIFLVDFGEKNSFGAIWSGKLTLDIGKFHL